jgi:hypothetical protein
LQAPEVMASLASNGLVSEKDARTVELVHAFSAAIGNNDAHLGNYALTFDAEGKARLAPIYDVTAMIFAPLADELPDSRVTPRTTPVSASVAPLFQTLVTLVSGRSPARRNVPCAMAALRRRLANSKPPSPPCAG